MKAAWEEIITNRVWARRFVLEVSAKIIRRGAIFEAEISGHFLRNTDKEIAPFESFEAAEHAVFEHILAIASGLIGVAAAERE